MTTRALLAWAAVLALTACGSTVPSAERQALQGESQVERQASGAGAGTPDTGVPSGDRPTVGPTAAAPGRAAAGARTSGRGSAVASARPSSRVGPGVTERSVLIGFSYLDTSGPTPGVPGGFNLGDPPAQARAVAGWINAHGGLGGRTMLLDVSSTAFADGIQNVEREAQRVCTRYTEDRRVFAVSTYLLTSSLVDCLAKHDTVAVNDFYPLDDGAFERHASHYYGPGAATTDRALNAAVRTFSDDAFLRGARVGIIHSGDPAHRRAAERVRAALVNRNVTVAAMHEGKANSLDESSADTSGAVLRFKASDVTHVIVIETTVLLAVPFMSHAESQQYRPAYALTSANLLPVLAQLAPGAQLARARALSWLPWEAAASDETPPALSASSGTCEAIYRSAGQDLSDRLARNSAMGICDHLLFIKAGFDRAAAPNADAFRGAVDGFGTRYVSAYTYGTRLAAGRHDGARVARVLRFDTGCGCWRYRAPAGDF